jgi:putative heme iron utilization protein
MAKQRKPRIIHMPSGKNTVLTMTSGQRTSDVVACMLTKSSGMRDRSTLIIESADRNGEVKSIALTGRQARTVFNVMQKHYMRGDKLVDHKAVADAAYVDGFMIGMRYACETCAAMFGV